MCQGSRHGLGVLHVWEQRRRFQPVGSRRPLETILERKTGSETLKILLARKSDDTFSICCLFDWNRKNRSD